MHNWSGVYDNKDKEVVKLILVVVLQSVLLFVQAGWKVKEVGIAPCCQVLGRDEEVLGHTSKNTIEEIWNGMHMLNYKNNTQRELSRLL